MWLIHKRHTHPTFRQKEVKRSSKDSNVPFQICLPSPPRASPLLFESFQTLAPNVVPSVQHGRLRGCRIVALLAPLEELAPFQVLVVVLMRKRDKLS